MPADAGIDSEEFDNGSSAVEREEAPGAEPIQNRSANREGQREESQRESGDTQREQQEDGDSRERQQREGDEQEEGDGKAASDAAKELNKRKRSLEGRKETIQQQINAKVRERGEIERDTARGRAERDQLLREIQSMRGMRDRLDAGEDVDPRELDRMSGGRGDRRDAGDPRRFDPRRPIEEDRAPWADPRDRRPREEDYRDFSEFSEAIGRWGARQEVRRAEFTRNQRAEMSDRQRWEAQRQSSYAKRYQAFAKENPDFEQEIDRDDLVLTAPMVDAIKDSAVGPQMMLHLARNPEDIDRISRLHPVHAFGEMKKIEARLEGAHSGSRQSTTEQPVTHSKARAPIKPVEHASSRNSGNEHDIPDEDVDMDEHIRRMDARDAQLRKQGVRRGYGARI